MAEALTAAERRAAWLRRRRRVRYLILLLGVGGAGAIGFWSLTHALIDPFGRDLVREWVVSLIEDLPGAGNALEELFPGRVEEVARQYDDAIRLSVGWLVAVVGGALFKGARIADALTGILYRPYNDWAFDPIGKSRLDIGEDEAFGVLGWQEPRGARLAVWNALRQEIETGVGEGTRSWLKPFGTNPLPLPFSFVLLLGRPGAGKSRMAHQFARELGRRDVLGSEAARQVWAARKLRWGEQVRRRLWFLRRRPDDPWDCGQIDQSLLGAQLERMDLWQPRRPTLLWLDDPAPGIARHVASTLETRAVQGAFRYPVRLVVTNQTWPLDLQEHQGTTREPAASLTLRSAGFGERDIRALAAQMLGPRDMRLARDADVRTFCSITGGNPLLVRLGLEWLAAGKPLRDMNRLDLVEQRLERVIKALRVAQFPVQNAKAMQALACTTLVGPGCPLAPVDAAFDGAFPARHELARAFPVEASGRVDLAVVGPAIRPELIGDAFVRKVIADKTPVESARAICETGFRARPAGWLRAVERLGGNGDDLANALAREPAIGPDELDLRVLVAQAWTKLALHARRDVHEVLARVARLIEDSSAPDEIATRLRAWFDDEIARDWAARLASFEDASGAEDEVVATFEDPYHRFIHGRPAALLGLELLRLSHETTPGGLDRSAEAVLQRIEQASRLVKRLERIGMFGILAIDRERMEACFEVLGAGALPAAEEADKYLHDLLTSIGSGFLDDARACLYAAAAKVARRVPGALAEVAATYFVVAPVTDEAQLSSDAIDRIEAVAGQGAYAADRDMQLARAKAWRHMALVWADDPYACRKAVGRVEAIVGPLSFRDDRELQLQRIIAWGMLTRALRAYPRAYGEPLRQIEQIAGQPAIASDHEVQLWRASAWRYFAEALDDEAAASREAVERVEAIAGRASFIVDRHAQSLRAEAWVLLVQALRSDARACREAVDRVEGIAAYPAYLGDHDLQLERAKALTILAHALSADPPSCREIADRVEVLAGHPAWIGDHHMQFQRAQAWRYLAYALSERPAACREAVYRVEALAEQVVGPAASRFQLERARAWAHLSFAVRDNARAHAQCILKLEDIVTSADPKWPHFAAVKLQLDYASSYRDA